MPTPALKHFQPNEIIKFKKCGSWHASSYLLDKPSAYALEMALASRRPLLVKGEPGLGKSYLARAAAAKLGRKFVAEVININTEGQDLLWRYDPIARLNDAQAGKEDSSTLHPSHYINPGVLWWVFGWKSAKEQYQYTCRHKIYCPQSCDEGDESKGVVLLIDEIDKADPSLPNSLLEVLGNGGFDVPLTEETIGDENQTEPLVIITTNDERELPPAFLRRCLVLNLKVDEDNLEEWLVERANVHFTDEQCSQSIKQEAAQQVKEDREQADKQGIVKPGLAEYLDLLIALDEMTDAKEKEQRDEQQSELLDELKTFVLQKV